MLQWLLYVFVVSVLLTAAGWLAEQGLRRSKAPTRWAWAAAMTLIGLIVYLSLPGLITLNAGHANRAQTSWTSIQHVAPVKLLPLILPPPPPAYAAAIHWDALMVNLWIALSLLMILTVATSGAYVSWRRRTWPMRLIGSHCVLITPDIGPAVVGLLRPTIAIPRWVLDRAPAQQQLILAHEASHLQARDPLLLTSSIVALILMPWNALLWWQWLRLRHAIEVDCDARVLRAGHDPQAYGEALIDVGEQRGRFVGVVAAMAETRMLLERRIEIMATRARKPSIYAFAARCAIATVVAAAATQIAEPDGSGNRQEISVDPATLDRYVGRYQWQSYILTITRDDAQLSGQLTGREELPLYAETPNQFFYRAFDAHVTFEGGDSGPATGLTTHRDGIDRIYARLDDTVLNRLRSEAALRKTIAVFGAIGVPDYDDMTAPVQNWIRRQLPAFREGYKDFGPVQSVEFRGVTDTGADNFLVTHQNGRQSAWLIALDADGKIPGVEMRPDTPAEGDPARTSIALDSGPMEVTSSVTR
jgi:bla regulator protein BlaR1